MMKAPDHPIDREEVMAYLDGEVSAERAAVIASHLEACGDCRTLADELRDVSRELAGWQVDPAPATIAAPVVAALAHRHRSATVLGTSWLWWQPTAGRLPRWATLSAAAAVAAGVIVLVVLPSLYRSSRYADFDPEVSPQETVRTAAEPDLKILGSRGSQGALAGVPAGPMLARTARLRLVAEDVGRVRADVDRILREHRGYVGELRVEDEPPARRTLTATVRVPVEQVTAALDAFKSLGRVLEESQSAEDVVEQHVDLQARLANARTTEQRLQELLRQRTGTVADLLAAEQELARVRGDIERLAARQKNLDTRVQFVTVELHVSEQARVSGDVGWSLLSTRLREALVGGARLALQSVLEAALLILQLGPPILIWLAILFWPTRWAGRRLRLAFDRPTGTTRGYTFR